MYRGVPTIPPRVISSRGAATTGLATAARPGVPACAVASAVEKLFASPKSPTLTKSRP